ncbi:Hypothetical protein A7982_09084 [Minicystis rosea]|nr:Hypothetical protein A7982_09084 [Minicystis rosea]
MMDLAATCHGPPERDGTCGASRSAPMSSRSRLHVLAVSLDP